MIITRRQIKKDEKKAKIFFLKKEMGACGKSDRERERERHSNKRTPIRKARQQEKREEHKKKMMKKK